MRKRDNSDFKWHRLVRDSLAVCILATMQPISPSTGHPMDLCSDSRAVVGEIAQEYSRTKRDVRRHERRLITSNLSFGEWGGVFVGAKMTTALLDRLTH